MLADRQRLERRRGSEERWGRPGPVGAGRGARGRWQSRLALALALWATSGAAEPLLHEYIELGPGDGALEAPAASAAAAAGGAPPGESPPAAGGSEPGDAAGLGADSPFSIDADTTRPDRVSYADPFTPTVVPFKRAVVYDGVNREGDLIVADRELVDVPIRTGPRPNDETFHASFELDLRPDERTPLPSVAPGAFLVLLDRAPRLPLRVGKDSAENWFVTTSRAGRVRLTLQIAADRRVFGSGYPDVGSAELARALPRVPPEVKQSALGVARALGIDEGARPQRVVASLVEHFRRFSASERRPTSQGLALYRELALTARGICRHRAYAFMLTALGLDVPTRVALNEAHAWVEVFDGELWHRIDLGGAASELEMADEGRPRHVAPRDPFSWPDRQESGLAMAERRSSPPAEAGAPEGQEPADTEWAPAEPPPGSTAQPETPPGDGAPAPAEAPPAEAPLGTPALEEPAPARVRLRAGAARAERGKSLPVAGTVTDANGRPCSGARVDVTLGPAEGGGLALGSVVSDARGEFRGSLVIPWNARLGEHTLSAAASGCAGR